MMFSEVYTKFNALFNSREQAYLFWGLVALVWALYYKNIRSSIAGVVKRLFCRQFIFVYVFSLSYSGLAILLLRFIGIWDASLIKDTMMWVLFVALPLMFQMPKVDSFKKFVKEIIRPLIAFSIIFEYIFGLYTFDLWIEILSVPVIVLIAGMLAVSERKPEHSQVNKLLKGLINLIGLIALGSVAVHLVRHHAEYENMQVLKQFLMPLCMSLLFLPFLYSLAMYIHYEDSLASLERHFGQPLMFRYAVLSAMFKFNGDIDGMMRWKQMVLRKNLQNKKEINEAISLIKTLQKAEENPHTVAEGLGWSPYQVKDLLVSKGIETADYKNTIDDEFMSISAPKKLHGNSFLSDSITYMVLGEQLIATQLHLGLKVHQISENSVSSILEFLNYAEALFNGVCGEELPKEIKVAILNGENKEVSLAYCQLTAKKSLWHNKDNGYSLDFKITHERHRL